MKVSVVDVVVIVLLGVSLFSFSTKYQPKYEFEYSGSQIYKVVRECDILDSTGFLYTVVVKGYWNTDIGHFEQEGFVTDTGRGYIEIVLKDGSKVTVGGKMGYKEDIQAVDIEIRIKSKSSVVYSINPKKGSKEEIRTYIEESAAFINYPKEDIALYCVFAIESDTERSLVKETIIEDELRKKIFFMKEADVEIFDDGMSVTVHRLSMKEFDTLFSLLERWFTLGEIYATDIKVIYQTAEEIDENDVAVLESYDGESICPGTVHVRV